jgi:hypothetical protein
MTRIQVREIAAEGTKGEIELRLDGGAPARTALTGKANNPVLFEAECPPAAAHVEVVARLTIRMAAGGPRSTRFASASSSSARRAPSSAA